MSPALNAHSWCYFNREASAKHVSNDSYSGKTFCYWLLESTVRPSPISFLCLSLPPPSYSTAQLSSKQQHTLVSVCECSQQLLLDTLKACVCVCVRCSIETFYCRCPYTYYLTPDKTVFITKSALSVVLFLFLPLESWKKKWKKLICHFMDKYSACKQLTY